MLPSFLPASSSSSIPAQTPLANSVGPQYRKVPSYKMRELTVKLQKKIIEESHDHNKYRIVFFSLYFLLTTINNFRTNLLKYKDKPQVVIPPHLCINLLRCQVQSTLVNSNLSGIHKNFDITKILHKRTNRF